MAASAPGLAPPPLPRRAILATALARCVTTSFTHGAEVQIPPGRCNFCLFPLPCCRVLRSGRRGLPARQGPGGQAARLRSAIGPHGVNYEPITFSLNYCYQTSIMIERNRHHRLG